MDIEGQIHPLYSDTTSSADWTMLEADGEMEMDQGEIAVVMLQGGLTGGPVGMLDFGFFDLVEQVEASTPTLDTYPETSIRFPNPVNDHLPIWTEDGTEELIAVYLFSPVGQELMEMRFSHPQHRIDLFIGNFQAGPYFLLIQTRSGMQPFWVLRM